MTLMTNKKYISYGDLECLMLYSSQSSVFSNIQRLPLEQRLALDELLEISIIGEQRRVDFAQIEQPVEKGQFIFGKW